MATPKSVLRNLYGEIKKKDFSNVKKFKRQMQQFMKSAEVDENSVSNFNKAIDTLPNDLDDFILITDPIMEKIEEWFKNQKGKSRVPTKSAWEKKMEQENPGLARHEKRQRRRKKHQRHFLIFLLNLILYNLYILLPLQCLSRLYSPIMHSTSSWSLSKPIIVP